MNNNPEQIKRIMCVCLGNSDRSPVMAAVLTWMLQNAGIKDVVVHSAGVTDSAKSGARAGIFGIRAAKLLGLDISGHKRQHVSTLLAALPAGEDYDLYVCVNDDVAGKLMEEFTDPSSLMPKMYNAQIPNPWPVQFDADYEPTMKAILSQMFIVIARYFPTDRR